MEVEVKVVVVDGNWLYSVHVVLNSLFLALPRFGSSNSGPYKEICLNLASSKRRVLVKKKILNDLFSQIQQVNVNGGETKNS